MAAERKMSSPKFLLDSISLRRKAKQGQRELMLKRKRKGTIYNWISVITRLGLQPDLGRIVSAECQEVLYNLLDVTSSVNEKDFRSVRKRV